MRSTFFSLEWKDFNRSPNFGINLVFKIYRFLIIIQVAALLTLFGVAGFALAQEEYPTEEPLKVICKFLIFVWLADITMRYFFQVKPHIKVLPFMILPIVKRKIVSFMMLKLIGNQFNILPFFLYLPMSIVLVIEGGGIGSLFFFLGLGALVFLNGFLAFLLQCNDKIAFAFLSVIITAGALHWFGIIDILLYTQQFFYALYEYWFLSLVFIIATIAIYKYIIWYFLNNFYIDSTLQKKPPTEMVDINPSLMKSFGKISPLTENNIRMIYRNLHPRKVFLSSFIFLFYGLFIVFHEDGNLFTKAIISVMVTGGFLLNFGENAASWDSEYYKLLMSQNIHYQEYLASKWNLMVLATFIFILLATPYLYFGWEFYTIIAMMGMYNIGVNSFLSLLGGAYFKTAIKLNEKAMVFGKQNNFNFKNLLIAIGKAFIPSALIVIIVLIVHDKAIAYLIFGGMSVIPLFFKNKILRQITAVYKKEKYDTIESFNKTL